METLPLIERSKLDDATRAYEYIFLFIEKYHELLSSDTTGLMQDEFTVEQNVLMAYNVFDNQVSNGGFIQLIENGFGPYVFDSPLSDHLRDWGLTKTSDLIDQARIIYQAKREILEREKSLEDFTRLYQEHRDFEPIESEYYAISDSEREVMKTYINRHIGDFARLMVSDIT
jgi:hypothetical protein